MQDLYDLQQLLNSFTEDQKDLIQKLLDGAKQLGAKQAVTMAPLSDPPKKDGKYLVIDNQGRYLRAKYTVFNTRWVWDNIYCITHWMELPEVPGC